jgi:hypothetical protein
MERESRRDKLARERAEWEAEQELKKQAKEARRETERALKEQRKLEKESTRGDKRASEEVSSEPSKDGFVPVPDEATAQVLQVSIDESAQRQKRVKAVRDKAPRRTASYKNAVRSGLEHNVAEMLEERNSILREWKSGVLIPEEAVNRLSMLSVRTKDGSLWKLLPRHGGVGLIKTGMDGSIEIVEPPRKRKRWPTVVSGFLFALLVLVTLWGTFWPATDGSQPDPAPRVTSQQEG